MKTLFATCILMLSVSFTYAQGEANNWYFGNKAGVTFNTTPPSALTNGQLATNEGCSAISDSSGNLLFYTDGQTIWNRNHQPMSNADYGAGRGLLGDPSSTSSGLIVPHPTDPNLYYVFAVDEPHHQNANAFPRSGPADEDGNSISAYTDTGGTVPGVDDGFNNGFTYSVVDMSLDGSLGNVDPDPLKKNVELITYDPSNTEDLKYRASEKITAVRGADCETFWVLTHFKDTFYAFQIDSTGVIPNAVESTVGPAISTAGYRRAAIGYMKASPDGSKIAIAHNTRTYNQPGNGDSGDGGVYVYDFDNATGIVSNNLELINNVNAYSVEFSSSSKRLYAAVSERGNATIQQWDLGAADIFASRVSISNALGANTALQLAPNGKIYHSRFSSQINVINKPDALGNAANYSSSTANGAISLAGRQATFGLPPFIQSIFSSRIDIINDPNELSTSLNLCDGESYMLSYEGVFPTTAKFVWFRKDQEDSDFVILPTETTSALTIQQPIGVTLPYTEEYRLEIDLGTGECPLIGLAVVTYFENPKIQGIPTDEALCDELDDGVEIFDFSTKDAEVLGNQNASTLTVRYFRTETDAIAGINELPINYEVTQASQRIFVRLENTDSLNCFEVSPDFFTISLLQKPEVLPDDSQIYCLENTVPVEISSGVIGNPNDFTYEWMPTGETTETISTSQIGTHIVTITDKDTGCSNTRDYTLEPSNIAQIVDVDITDLSSDNTLVVNLSDDSIGDYEYALDNELGPYQDENIFTGVLPGTYTIYVRDKNGCGIGQLANINVLGFMEFFTPNQDGFNDRWRVLGVSATNQANAQVYIFDRFGKLLTQFKAGSGAWNGVFNGRNMPSNDYWYKVILEDGRVFRSNFTLKR